MVELVTGIANTNLGSPENENQITLVNTGGKIICLRFVSHFIPLHPLSSYIIPQISGTLACSSIYKYIQHFGLERYGLLHDNCLTDTKSSENFRTKIQLDFPVVPSREARLPCERERRTGRITTLALIFLFVR